MHKRKSTSYIVYTARLLMIMVALLLFKLINIQVKVIDSGGVCDWRAAGVCELLSMVLNLFI